MPFCCIYISITGCNPRIDEEIHLADNIYLFAAEGNTNNGYSIVQKSNEHFYMTLVEQNPIKISWTPFQCFVIQKDNYGFISYHKIIIYKSQSTSPKVIDIPKNQFEREVTNCISCKEIGLLLDTAKGIWVVQRQKL